MNSFALLLALQQLLESQLKNTPFLVAARPPSPAPAPRPPKVYINDLPFKEQAEANADPFVLLRILSGYDQEGQHRVNLAVIVGIHNNEGMEDIENDLLTLVNGVRHSLAPFRSTALNGSFKLLPGEKERELEWERPENQNYPYHRAHVLTHWAMKGLE